METYSVTTEDGLQLKVNCSGSGSSLVIVHGWINSTDFWTPFIQNASSDFTCYCWNARMHSTSRNISMAQMARDIYSVISQLGLDDVVLMGHSMGALAVWEYISQFGNERISKIVIIDQTPKIITDEDWSLGLYGDFDSDKNRDFIDWLSRDFVSGGLHLGMSAYEMSAEQKAKMQETDLYKARRDFVASLTPEPWIEAWRSLSQQDYRDVLNTIDVPVFLAYGKQCCYYGEKVALFVHENVPDNKLVVYSPATHYPHLEAPDQFYADLKAFVYQ